MEGWGPLPGDKEDGGMRPLPALTEVRLCSVALEAASSSWRRSSWSSWWVSKSSTTHRRFLSRECPDTPAPGANPGTLGQLSTSLLDLMASLWGWGVLLAVTPWAPRLPHPVVAGLARQVLVSGQLMWGSRPVLPVAPVAQASGSTPAEAAPEMGGTHLDN